MTRATVEIPSAFEDVELYGVVVQEFSASLVRLGPVEGMQFSLGTSWAFKDDEGLLCRFVAKCNLFDANVGEEQDPDDDAFVKNHQLARLRCAIVCEYELPSAEWDNVKACGPEVMRQFSQDVALPAAFPYIREAISSMSTRLGFPRITLGSLHRDRDMTFGLRTF